MPAPASADAPERVPEASAVSPSSSTQRKQAGNIGGRGTKRRADGVVYTPNKKRCAVYYVFGDATTRGLTVKDRAKKLGVGMPTMYDWKKSYPEAWSTLGKLDASSPVAREMRDITSRPAAQNLTFFLTSDDPATWSPNGAAGSSTVTAPAQNASQSTTAAVYVPAFVRPDGLGPNAEPQETFGGRGPGVLPPELVQQLAKEGAPATDKEIAAVHATKLDKDASSGAAPYINETIDLALHLKQSTLAPKVKKKWDGVKKHFLAFWRCLNRIRAQQQSGDGSEDGVSETSEENELEDILVSEQKLVTYLNCYVLHKNPTIGDKGIETHIKAVVNLWETQTLQGRNYFPHPRNGALMKAFTKALKHGRSALAAAKFNDAWKHTLKDGYDPEEYQRISRWYLKQEETAGEDRDAWVRARFDFLMQHAIMGRSEDLRNAKLSYLYVHTVPQSRPQTCKAVVVSIRHSKTNVDARREFGIAARHKNVETCPIGALALYFFQRFHMRDEFPDLSSRTAWYELNLLVDDEERGGIEWVDQAGVLRQAFSDLGISSSKLTHAMRGAAARHAHEAGCSEASIRIHGRWTASGDQLIERYLTGIAVQPVRALSGFHIEGGDHYLPRTLLDPPASLTSKLWPQLDEAEASVRSRHATGGQKDEAALAFLEVMRWLWVVLLQDAALLSTSFPSLPIWSTEPFISEDFKTFRSELTTKIAETPHPLEVTITEIIPRLGHALADVRASSAETTEAFKQAISAQQVDNERLRLTLERAITTLSESIERRDQADESRAQAQQVIMSSICALAGASSTLQSTHTNQHEQQQQTLQMLVRLMAASTLPASLPSAAGSTFSSTTPAPNNAHASPSSSTCALTPPLLDQPSSPAPIPAPTPLVGQQEHELIANNNNSLSTTVAQERPAPSASIGSAASSVLQSSPILLPRTLLCIAAKASTVKDLATEWYTGKDDYVGVRARLEAKDEALESKGSAARKQICRWRRVIGVLEALQSQ
ncbi:hypothetical protein A4X06_0g8631, partial [Tilletia controversa]